MEIVRTALSGPAATTFFSEFLKRGESALAETLDWDIFAEVLAPATGPDEGSKNTSGDACAHHPARRSGANGKSY